MSAAVHRLLAPVRRRGGGRARHGGYSRASRGPVRGTSPPMNRLPADPRPGRLARSVRGHRGFSLMELLVTVAVAAVLLGLGVPNMTRLLARHAASAQADELRDALRGARSEAMKRSGPVAVCRMEAASPGRCAETGGDWRTWMVYADLDRSGSFAAGEPMLAAHTEASGRLAAGADVAQVRFEATGIARRAAIRFTPAGDASGGAGTRLVCVDPRGDIAVVADGGACP